MIGCPRWLRNRWGMMTGLATVVVVAFSLWASLGVGDPALNAFISNFTFLPLSLFAAIAAFRVTRDEALSPHLRRAWLFLGLAVFAYFVGDVVWFIQESVLQLPVADSPYSLADLFYPLFYPFALIGLVSLPVAPLERSERLRFWLDLLIVMTAAWMVVWYLVISPATTDAEEGLAQLVAGIYPVGDLVVMGGIVSLLFRRPDHSARSALLLFMAGLMAFVVTDWTYAYTLLTGLYESGGLLDVGWVVAYVFFALAAIRQRAPAEGTVIQRISSLAVENISLALPFLAIAIGYGLLLVVASGQWHTDTRLTVELIAGAVLTVLVIGRQTVALRENMRLNAALKQQYELLQIEQDKSERLLLNILPGPIATRLKQQEITIADSFPEVTVLFADLVGFTPLSAHFAPEQLVIMLNDLFSAFDALAETHGLEKIKTIGDAYMAVSGLPTPNPNHAEAAARMSLAMHAALHDFATKWNVPLQIRVGLNTGPVVAGVIGQKKFIYDLWGDTVNIASRMESQSAAGHTQVTEATHRALCAHFVLEPRGTVAIKGKGEMQTYFLMGER